MSETTLPDTTVPEMTVPDALPAPYRSDQRVQLFIGQPMSEWLVEQFVWAGSLEIGETAIFGSVDTAFGVAAKSWLSEVPRFDDLEVANDAERYAIDELTAWTADPIESVGC